MSTKPLSEAVAVKVDTKVAKTPAELAKRYAANERSAETMFDLATISHILKDNNEYLIRRASDPAYKLGMTYYKDKLVLAATRPTATSQVYLSIYYPSHADIKATDWYFVEASDAVKEKLKQDSVRGLL